MKIFVTGAMGYKGTVLVPRLLECGYDVIAFDIGWFGNRLKKHPNLRVIEGDIRDPSSYSLEGVEAVIHLASIANDPAGDLNPKLTWEISCLATHQLIEKSVRSGVKQFLYASSGSVYGIKDEENVTEELSLFPLTEYNKTKMCAERIIMSYSDEIITQIIRPATVCGFSPTMRNDVSVNLLTFAALKQNKITVFGGKQVRPNIHIQDIINVYLHFLENSKLSGVFNAGFENISILDIAKNVQQYLDVDIEITSSNDPRSYRINSDKLISTGFTPKRTVSYAIQEMIEKFNAGQWEQDDSFYRMKWMKDQSLC